MILPAVIALKGVLNLSVAAAFFVEGKSPMGLMFFGFAVADVGALWVSCHA